MLRRWSGLRPGIRVWQNQRVLSFSTDTFGLAGRDDIAPEGEQHVPVLIVGAGPVGLVLSMLLTKLGVDCAVIEKRTAFSNHPQAHFINNRSMEIFRKLDGLSDEIQERQPPIDLWRKFVYCTSLSGPILGSVDHMKPEDFERLWSPTAVAHFSQHKLTEILLQKLEILGFSVHTPEEGLDVVSVGKQMILMGHECVSISMTNKGIVAGVSSLKLGNVRKINLHCSILVGSDGAKSTVRKLVDVRMKGERELQKLISVHFKSRDLGQYLLNQRPGMLFFIFNPDCIGVLVAHNLNDGEFVLQIPYYPPQQNFEDFSSKICEDIILKLVGHKLVDLQVLDIKPWVMHAEVAENYVSHDDRVVLVGDAAHRFPPAGGFGMNTGIQDAHNLAWKIASIASGATSFSILRTYETERKPIALSNTALSIQNFEAAMSVPAALGLDPKLANSVHRVINKGVGTFLPSGLQKLALEGAFAIGRAQLSPYVLNQSNPIGASRLEKLKRIFDDGKSLQLQFPAEDLGFRYQKGVLIPETDDVGHANTYPRKGSTCSKRGSREYIPSSTPGSRLPHMSMKSLHSSEHQALISTLDLVPGDKLAWVLIISPRKNSYDIAQAAVRVGEERRISIKICVIWSEGSFRENVNGSLGALPPSISYVDVEEVKNPALQKSWWEICQMTCEGYILVRPDEHIAWREKNEVGGDLELKMREIFSLIFG